MKIEITEREDIRPVCPHCSTELRSIFTQKLAGFMGRREVYFCGTCRKVLGMSHRKAFWMN